jgi:hypothetical protein
MDFTAAPTGGGNAITLCTSRPVVSGSAICNTSSLPAGSYTVTATYTGDTTFNQSQAGNETSVSQQVNPNANVSGTNTGTSDGTSAKAIVGGTNPGDSGSYSATASPGTANTNYVTVQSFVGNPTSTDLTNGADYFDVKLSTPNSFSAVTIVDCQLGTATPVVVDWYNGTTWAPITASIDTTTHAGCATFTVTSSTSPSISDLTGTPFATTNTPTYSPIQMLHASIHKGQLTLRWTVSSNSGIMGFRVYANHHRLTKQLIPVHASRSYRYSLAYTGRGPYVLRVLMRSGQVLKVPAR